MRVLIVGGSGMLGTDVVAECQSRGWDVEFPSSKEFDITDPMDSARLAAGELGKFNVCFNCAAYTAVDKAESEREVAFSINALGPSYLSRSCGANGTRLIHISTDFVFDGVKTEPYVETDTPHPFGVYAISKYQGEDGALSGSPGAIVVRTSWLFGPNGQSFPRSLIRAWLADKALRVVDDQLGTPTYTTDLARVLADMAEAGVPGGIYHAAGPTIMSWKELAEEAIYAYRDAKKLTDRDVRVEPIRSEYWPTPVKRPAFSALSFEKLASLGVEPMRPIETALSEFVGRLKEPI